MLVEATSDVGRWFLDGMRLVGYEGVEVMQKVQWADRCSGAIFEWDWDWC